MSVDNPAGKFTGSLVAIVTPMRPDGAVDHSAWSRLVDFHLQNGTSGIVVGGTTGESVTITKRGKPVGELRPAAKRETRLTFGCMKHPAYRFDDPFSPAVDPGEVHANDPSKWDDLP